nr:hypothetical protein Itr_chr04CG25110 [Ipomoea trifida]
MEAAAALLFLVTGVSRLSPPHSPYLRRHQHFHRRNNFRSPPPHLLHHRSCPSFPSTAIADLGPAIGLLRSPPSPLPRRYPVFLFFF